jgi:hypothetical protein
MVEGAPTMRIRLGPAALAVLLVVLVAAISPLGPGLQAASRLALDSLAARGTHPQATAPAIAREIQALNRLEAARQVSRHVIEARADGHPLLPASSCAISSSCSCRPRPSPAWIWPA